MDDVALLPSTVPGMLQLCGVLESGYSERKFNSLTVSSKRLPVLASCWMHQMLLTM